MPYILFYISMKLGHKTYLLKTDLASLRTNRWWK